MISDSVVIFPDGKNSEDYQECLSWPCHQWAWEFLRRNPSFQESCDGYERNPTISARDRLKKEFGLVRYKHYREGYGTTKKVQPKFSTGDVACWARVSEENYKRNEQTLPKSLRGGQVLIRFDLRKMHETKASSIKAMLDSTERYLNEKANTWMEVNEFKSSNRKIKVNLVVLLRLLDLERGIGSEVSGEDKLKIVDEDFRENFESENSVNDPEGTYRDRIAAAKRYRDEGYLHLATSRDLPPFAEKLLKPTKIPIESQSK